MFCKYCGSRLPDGASFCSSCGNALRVPDAVPPAPVSAAATSGFMMAGSLDLEEPAAVTSPATPARTAPPQDPEPAFTPPTSSPAWTSPPPAPPIPPAQEPEAAPQDSVPSYPSGDSRRISPKRELKLLLHQGWLVMLGERRNLIISLLFPLLAAIIIVWIAGEFMFDNYESTKSGCFIIVCAAIWGGLFNSIQSIVKERENIKRDYVSGALRIGCYTTSRAILQFFLCLIQSLVLCLSIPAVGIVHGNDIPESGALGLPSFIEYYISIFLIMYASDAMGLLISSFVKKDELASKLAPYILIAQLLFSGALFVMEGGAKILSAVMISRWGMAALGTISDVDDLPLRLVTEDDMLAHLPDPPTPPASDDFAHEPGHLLLVWGIMLLFIVIPLIGCNVCLKKVKNDTRG